MRDPTASFSKWLWILKLLDIKRNSFSWKNPKVLSQKTLQPCMREVVVGRLKVRGALRRAGPAYSISGLSVLSNELLDKADLQEKPD